MRREQGSCVDWARSPKGSLGVLVRGSALPPAFPGTCLLLSGMNAAVLEKEPRWAVHYRRDETPWLTELTAWVAFFFPWY